MKRFMLLGLAGTLACVASAAMIARAQRPADERAPQELRKTQDSEGKPFESKLELKAGQSFYYTVDMGHYSTMVNEGKAKGATEAARDSNERVAYTRQAKAGPESFTLIVEKASGDDATIQVSIGEPTHESAGPAEYDGMGQDQSRKNMYEEPLEGTQSMRRQYTVTVKDGKVSDIVCEAGESNSDRESCCQVVSWIVGSGLHGKKLRTSEVYRIDASAAKSPNSSASQRASGGSSAEKPKEKGGNAVSTVKEMSISNEMPLADLSLRLTSTSNSGPIRFDVIDGTKKHESTSASTRGGKSEKSLGEAVYRAEDGLLDSLVVHAADEGTKRGSLRVEIRRTPRAPDTREGR